MVTVELKHLSRTNRKTLWCLAASGIVCSNNLRVSSRRRRFWVYSRMVIHLNSAHKLTHCLRCIHISHMCQQAVNYGHQLLRLHLQLQLNSWWCRLSSCFCGPAVDQVVLHPFTASLGGSFGWLTGRHIDVLTIRIEWLSPGQIMSAPKCY